MRDSLPNLIEKSPDLIGKSSVSVRIGRWFEARGTGWGVIAIPLLLLLLMVLANSRLAG